MELSTTTRDLTAPPSRWRRLWRREAVTAEPRGHGESPASTNRAVGDAAETARTAAGAPPARSIQAALGAAPVGAPRIETPKIQVRGLSFYYGKTQALERNDLDIAPRRVTAIIGPSGCGKSTHLRVYNRIFELYRDQRAEGEVRLDGRNLLAPDVDVIELRRQVGMIFQKPTPFPMSVFDNVAYGLRLHYRLSRSELAGRVEEALQSAALWDEVKDKLGAPGTALSGGQQQRLCIARALAVEPEVLLMDEPTSAIDPVATSKIEALVETLKERYTIVIVTHNMQQAARISDYTAFFYEGRIVEFGDTKQIFTKPRLKQTEDYITGRFG